MDPVAQMVSNLVRNALDYSVPGAPVRVAVRVEAGEQLIEVHNEGPEIAPELRAHLFDPFRQSHPPGRASSGRGLGLGLFIAHEIARSHAGSIAVESSPERGTTFTVRLPLGGSAQIS